MGDWFRPGHCGFVAATMVLVVALVACGSTTPTGNAKAPRMWLGSVALSPDASTLVAALSLNARGDGVVLWQGFADRALWSRRLLSGHWAPVDLVENHADPRDALVAVNDIGVAFALWTATDPSVGWSRLRVARQLPGASWEPAVAIEAGTGRGDADGAQLAVFGDGSALVVWEGYDGLFACRFDPQTGWTPPEILRSERSSWSRPVLVSDATSALVLLWRVEDGWVARHLDSVKGWGSEDRLPGPSLQYPTVVLTSAGAAVVLWYSN